MIAHRTDTDSAPRLPLRAARGFRSTCAHCAAPDTRMRLGVLQLLALIEHPDALPPELALRAAAQLMELTRTHRGLFRFCD